MAASKQRHYRLFSDRLWQWELCPLVCTEKCRHCCLHRNGINLHWIRCKKRAPVAKISRCFSELIQWQGIVECRSHLVCDSQDFSRSASVMRQRIAMSSVSFCQQVKLIIKLKIKKKCPSFCCRLSEKYITHPFTTVKSNRKERFMMQRIRADRLRSLQCHICAHTHGHPHNCSIRRRGGGGQNYWLFSKQRKHKKFL